MYVQDNEDMRLWAEEEQEERELRNKRRADIWGDPIEEECNYGTVFTA